ncbi:MAG: hypothetical protein RR014_05580, partial [Bilophila sp.]
MPVIMQGKRVSFSVKASALLVSLSFIAGLIAATQFFAWRLSYQVALGLHANHVYYPWRILQWANVWWNKHPEL